MRRTVLLTVLASAALGRVEQQHVLEYEDDFAQRLETQWHGSRVLAYAFLSSVGVSKADLVNVFDLPVHPPIPPKAPQFVHLDNLISMEDHEDT